MGQTFGVMIEVQTFRLAAGTDLDSFLAADRRVQEEVVNNERGFVRRTTARDGDGEWVVTVLWDSEADADAAPTRGAGHPATAAFARCIDSSSLRIHRYESLD